MQMGLQASLPTHITLSMVIRYARTMKSKSLVRFSINRLGPPPTTNTSPWRKLESLSYAAHSSGDFRLSAGRLWNQVLVIVVSAPEVEGHRFSFAWRGGPESMQHGVYARATNADKKPTFALVMAARSDSFDTAVLRSEMARRGYRLELTAATPDHSAEKLIGIGIITNGTQDALNCAFSFARWSQEQRIVNRAHFPVTIVNCSGEVLPSVRADFFRYGCSVASHATPQQLGDILDTALIDVGRRSRRGVTLSFRGQFVPMLTCAGREEELPAKGRLMSLLVALCREQREFSSPELAAVLTCKTSEGKSSSTQANALKGTG